MPLWRGRRPDLGPVSRDSAEEPASAGSSHFRTGPCQGATDAAGEGAADPAGMPEAAGAPPVMGAHGSGDPLDPGEALAAMSPTVTATQTSWLRSGDP